MKKITVMDWCNAFGGESDNIPVVIRCRDDVIARGKSCYWYVAHGGLELERKISSVTVKKDLITIQVK